MVRDLVRRLQNGFENLQFVRISRGLKNAESYPENDDCEKIGFAMRKLSEISVRLYVINKKYSSANTFTWVTNAFTIE